VTDHKPLTWIFKINGLSFLIMRLKLKLQEFYYTTVHKKGKESVNSDGLSRIFSETEPRGETVHALTEKAEELNVIQDSEESGDTEEKRRGKDELETACDGSSDKEKLEILKEIHDSPIGGHVGINRTYRKLKQFNKLAGYEK